MKLEGRDPVLRKSRWLLLRRSDNLKIEQHFRLRDLLRYNLKTVRAYLLKEAFQQLWDYNSPTWAGKFLDEWCRQTMRSRIEPMKKIARSILAAGPGSNATGVYDSDRTNTVLKAYDAGAVNACYLVPGFDSAHTFFSVESGGNPITKVTGKSNEVLFDGTGNPSPVNNSNPRPGSLATNPDATTPKPGIYVFGDSILIFGQNDNNDPNGCARLRTTAGHAQVRPSKPQPPLPTLICTTEQASRPAPALWAIMGNATRFD